MSKSLIKNILSNLYLLTVVLGGLVFFTYVLKKGDIYRSQDKCEKKLINKISCKTSESVDLVYRELSNIRYLLPGRRLEYISGLEEYKNEPIGFNFNYQKNLNNVNGFLLLSKHDPENLKPAIELWNLNSQEKVHSWNINYDELTMDMSEPDKQKLRLKHPVLLNDGSIITIATNENAPVLKYDMCGVLQSKNQDHWYHHSVEVDKEGLVYIPVNHAKSKSLFYDNYRDFKGKRIYGEEVFYRDQAIAILDKDLKLKKVIPLDQIFYSIGLLHDVNSPFIKNWNDPYHLNDIHPFTNNSGDKILYLSMRSYGLISFNQSKNKVEWVMRGIADRQHDITPIPNKVNSVSIFDNGVKKNTPLGNFRGNSLIEIEFPKTKTTKYYLGRNLFEQGLSKKRIYFDNLPKNLIPNTETQGRGRFLTSGNIFIEATNQGKMFEYDPKNKKILWSYLNKAKSGKIFMLSWSRYYDELPEGLEINKFKSCKKN